MDGHKGNHKGHSVSSRVTNSNSSDKPSVNLVSSLQENTILVTIGDKKTRCLVDTGATISCASLAYLKKTGINCTHLKPANIKYIDHEVSIDQSKHQNHGGENNLTMNQTHADSTTQSTSQEANPSSSQSDDTYYEVENLLKMKFMKGKKHYLVRWKGNYSDTWEPEDFITEKPKREFHIRRARQGKRKRKSGNRYFTY